MLAVLASTFLVAVVIVAAAVNDAAVFVVADVGEASCCSYYS